MNKDLIGASLRMRTGIETHNFCFSSCRDKRPDSKHISAMEMAGYVPISLYQSGPCQALQHIYPNRFL